MQVCQVCGLLFLGGGACPTCGSQVATDLDSSEVGKIDESIPGLDVMADAIGEASGDVSRGNVLPFGIGAKAEVMKSSLPFGVGSPIHKQDVPDSQENGINDQIDTIHSSFPESPNPSFTESDIKPNTPSEDKTAAVVVQSKDMEEEFSSANSDIDSDFVGNETEVIFEDETLDNVVNESPNLNQTHQEEKSIPSITGQQEATNDIPEMWRIDAAEVNMDEIYARDEEIIEVSFEDDSINSDVEVKFDELHYEPVEDSMASDEDAPQLHPAQALPVETSGEPELENMIDSAFDYMAQGSWVDAAQILSTASANRQNDSTILNNLGLSLLQSALDMDAKTDPMSSSQYEAAIMALRQSAKIDPENNTILLNLSHALLVSGRAEKSMGVLNVIRKREPQNVEIANTIGACLIQLGRDSEAMEILSLFDDDEIVAANIALL